MRKLVIVGVLLAPAQAKGGISLDDTGVVIDGVREKWIGLQWEAQLSDRFTAGERYDFYLGLEMMGVRGTTMSFFSDDDLQVNILELDKDREKQWLEHVNRMTMLGRYAVVYYTEETHNEGKSRYIDWETRVRIMDRGLNMTVGKNVIHCVGEEWSSSAHLLFAMCEYLKVRGAGVTAVHNPHGSQDLARFWESLEDEKVKEWLDLVMIQASLQDAPAMIKRAKGLGYKVMLHEQMPWQTGTDWRKPDEVEKWFKVSPESVIGYSIYPGFNLPGGCTDLDCRDPLVYLESLRSVTSAKEGLLGRDSAVDLNGDLIIDAADLMR